MRTLLNLLWDQPQLRADFVTAWRETAREFNRCSEAAAWRLVRGPVSGAWAHIKRIDASWTAPFRINVLSHDVDLLLTPPLQVMKLIRAHARRYYDNELTARLCQTEGMPEDLLMETLNRYSNGINWDIVRTVLNNKSGQCDGGEIRGLQLVATNALWTEERRWLAGHRGEGSCEVCRLAIGTKKASATRMHRHHATSRLEARGRARSQTAARIRRSADDAPHTLRAAAEAPRLDASHGQAHRGAPGERARRHLLRGRIGETAGVHRHPCGHVGDMVSGPGGE